LQKQDSKLIVNSRTFNATQVVSSLAMQDYNSGIVMMSNWTG